VVCTTGQYQCPFGTCAARTKLSWCNAFLVGLRSKPSLNRYCTWEHRFSLSRNLLYPPWRFEIIASAVGSFGNVRRAPGLFPPDNSERGNHSHHLNACYEKSAKSVCPDGDGGSCSYSYSYSCDNPSNHTVWVSENFDGVTAPALPAGWLATNAQGQPPLWVHLEHKP